MIGQRVGRGIAVAGMVVLLSGCSSGWSESNLNPMTWVGRSDTPESLVPVEQQLFVDARPLMTELTALSVDPTPGGVILRATGIPPTQGYWDGELVVENANPAPVNGVLSFQFRILPPPAGTPAAATVGGTRSREVVVGKFISRQELAGVTTLRVVAERNERSVRP
ncbi:hypothetical protein ACRDNQ_04165 [Palleronia sp. KMU-117]|uniref:hypothetical protein n=1 Tax=Palleronia sp. KMU-117 TaxID=3434108 RepID=UPI003D763807